jgi:transcriptional regulator with XRE-family HTH domain
MKPIVLELASKRKNNHIRQRAVAHEIGVSELTIIDIERGRLPVTDSTIQAISEAIDKLSIVKKNAEDS